MFNTAFVYIMTSHDLTATRLALDEVSDGLYLNVIMATGNALIHFKGIEWPRVRPNH